MRTARKTFRCFSVVTEPEICRACAILAHPSMNNSPTAQLPPQAVHDLIKFFIERKFICRSQRRRPAGSNELLPEEYAG